MLRICYVIFGWESKKWRNSSYRRTRWKVKLFADGSDCRWWGEEEEQRRVGSFFTHLILSCRGFCHHGGPWSVGPSTIFSPSKLPYDVLPLIWCVTGHCLLLKRQCQYQYQCNAISGQYQYQCQCNFNANTNAMSSQGDAGKVHPSNRSEDGHLEPKMEREIQIVSLFINPSWPGGTSISPWRTTIFGASISWYLMIIEFAVTSKIRS